MSQPQMRHKKIGHFHKTASSCPIKSDCFLNCNQKISRLLSFHWSFECRKSSKAKACGHCPAGA
jgi:hypothetical protein